MQPSRFNTLTCQQAIGIALLTTVLLTGCDKLSNFASNDVYLKCIGDVTVDTQGSVNVMGSQEIAAHLTTKEIGFSDNGHLSGDHLKICDGKNADDLSFDSQSCDPHIGSTRGVLNRITGTLILTNEVKVTLATIRQQYPEYSRVSDEDLARGLYNKIYSSQISFDDFSQKIGYKTALEPPSLPMLIQGRFKCTRVQPTVGGR
jgi:hypothetical protein